MTKTFDTYGDLTKFIMFEIADRVPGSDIGVSSVSVSRYVEAEDGRRVRISDHDATASCGGGIVFDIDIRDFNIEEIYDDCHVFECIEVCHDWKIDEAIDAAVKALS